MYKYIRIPIDLYGIYDIYVSTRSFWNPISGIIERITEPRCREANVYKVSTCFLPAK